MTIYDYIRQTGNTDVDFWDTEYDNGVTICFDPEDEVCDSYDAFCDALVRVVQYVPENHADWAGFITKNQSELRAFSNQNWRHVPNNEEDFVYEWINELHNYVAGYVWDSFYDKLVALVKSLQPSERYGE